MTQSTRKPGFRLPWSGEGEDAPAAADEAAPAANGATPAANGPTPAANGATPAQAEQPAPGETVVGEIGPPATVSVKEEGTASTAAPPPATGAEDTSDFLRSLVGAMRGVAEEERNASVSELRQSVDGRIAELETRAAERAEELRRTADLDIAGIGDWAKGEIERINDEAAHKVDGRRQQLEQQLADHATRSTAEAESVRERLANYERELEAFFAQLTGIDDPASFVAAARRMPKAPTFDGGTAASAAPAETASTGSLDARLAQLGIDRSQRAAMPADSPAESDPATAAAEAAPADVAPAQPPADTAEPEPPAVEEPAAAQEPAASDGRDAQLAHRLAELDARPEPSTATTPAPGGDDEGTEIATAIMVKGLGSFGAITSFKQRLERLATVRSVTLSLGPTGEFVYRATHARETDLGAAITTLEPGSTVDRHADGSLRVTVQSR